MTLLLKTLKYAFITFLMSTYKTLPLAYFVRVYYHIFRNLFIERFNFNEVTRENTFGIGNDESSKLGVFQTVTLNTYVSPFECDIYLHKSNSTYFTELDVSRTDLITRVFQKLFWNYQDNVSPNKKFLKKSMRNFPYLPVGNVTCVFKRELPPFAKYSIQSRVLSWDKKWFFVVSKFVNSKGDVCCVGLTKYVFKNGKITISPREFIEECGLWNDEVELINQENYKMCQSFTNTEDLENVCVLI